MALRGRRSQDSGNLAQDIITFAEARVTGYKASRSIDCRL